MNICDYGCGKEAAYQFKNGKWCCSKNWHDCIQIKEKRKQTNMEKYGSTYPLQSKEIQGKIKQTNIEKYGIDHPIKSKEVKEKIKQTNIKKYGVENPFQNKKVQEKIKQTNIKKYGVENPSKNKEIKEKRKQTYIEKYGVEHPTQNIEVQKRMKKTFMEKYGAGHHNQSLEIKEKLLKNHQFFCQVEDIRIEDNQFKVHCKNSNCVNSKEKGGWFTPTPIQIHNRIGELEDKTGSDGKFFYCSQYCKDTCPAYNLRSDPNKENQLPYTQEQLQTFRTEVLTRDNYTCQYCGEPATDVHHERPVKLEPELSLDPMNGWSCCKKCHYEKGHQRGTNCSTGALAAKVCNYQSSIKFLGTNFKGNIFL